MIGLRRVVVGFLVATVLAATLAPLNSVQALVVWVLNEETVSLGITGASAHVDRLSGVDRVWRSGGLLGSELNECNDAGACTAVALTGRWGTDFTILTLANGSRRAFFVDLDPTTSTKSVKSAACVNAGCTELGTSVLTNSGLTVSSSPTAWGVPDPVLLPDGRVRLYVVESPVVGSCTEKLASYVSADGITFTKESGWRLEGGISVDPEILRAKDGNWVMVLADGPGCGDMVQKLYLSTSTDGLTWSTPQKLTGSDLSRLDPTGYEVSTDVFRIYYSTAAPGLLGDKTYTIKRATLTIKPATIESSTTSQPSITSGKSSKTSITCVKGKATKKVTGINPKCPKGYKKK